MKKSLLTMLCFAIAALSGGVAAPNTASAAPVTLTFNDGQPSGWVSTYTVAAGELGNVTFKATNSGTGVLFGALSAPPSGSGLTSGHQFGDSANHGIAGGDDDTAVLSPVWLAFATDSGAEFTFISFDVGAYLVQEVNSIEVVGYRNGSQVSGAVQQITFTNGEYATETKTLNGNFANVDEIRMRQTTPGIYDNGYPGFGTITINNIVLQAVATEPEPAHTVQASAATSAPVVGADNDIALTVKDSEGSVDTAFDGAKNVTISGVEAAPNGSYGSFGGTELTADAAGAGQVVSVTFADGVAAPALALHKADAQTVQFSVAGVTTAATNNVTITPTAGAAATMTLTQNITAPAVNGGAFATQPIVTLRDGYGNVAVGDDATVVTASKKDAGDWTLTGTLTATAVDGVAWFSGLGAMNAEEVADAQLAFNAGALAEVTSATVTLPGPAGAHTAEASVASFTPAVGADNEIALTVKNTLGNVDANFDGVKNVTISGVEAAPNGSYGSFGGTELTADAAGAGQVVSVTFADGVAAPALALHKADAQTVQFSVAGVTTAATNTVTITPTAGAAATMTLTQNITAPAVNGGAFATQPIVTLRDGYGNVAVGDDATVVTASKKDAGDWSLTGSASATAVDGVATFSGLGATNAEEVTNAQLAFNAGALAEVTSATVTLPAPAGAHTAEASAATLTPVVGADNAIMLSVKNTLGNVDANFDGAKNVTISGIEAAPNGTYGSFGGTELTADAAGAGQVVSVTFADGVAAPVLALHKADAQTVQFSVAGVTTAATNAVTIAPTAGTAASMTLTQNVTAPPMNGGMFATQPIVTLRDAYGNVAVGDDATVVTASKKDAGAWSLTGSASATAVDGVATFSGLGAQSAAETKGAKLAFHAEGLSGIESAVVTIPWPALSAPALETAELGNGRVLLRWTEVVGAAEYVVFQSTTSGQYGAPAAANGQSQREAELTGLTNGTGYYFVVKAKHPGGESGASNEVNAVPYTVPGAPTNAAATPGNGQATVSFTAPADNGGRPIAGYKVTASPGNKVVTGTAGPIVVTGLTNGTAYTFTVKAINAAGSGAASVPTNAVTPSAPPSGDPDPTPTPTPAPQRPVEPAPTGVDVLVNGKAENAGTATTATVNGQRVTTVAVDPRKLEERLASEGQGAVITIPVQTQADVVVGELNGRMVRNMEQKQATVEIRTANAAYTLPAAQINIGSVSEALGGVVELQDIKVRIGIAEPAPDAHAVVMNAAAAGGFEIVAPPLEFTVQATYGDSTVDVTRFNAYVERAMALPEGTDPSKITTGVVVDPDGTVRHVPTKVENVEGTYYAVINSLTNSLYSVVWHPMEFRDAEGHWAQSAVNDMGSRMVVEGAGDASFQPDQAVTRAEFAAILVRALGLKPELAPNAYKDVSAADWFADAVGTANAYNLVNGYEDGAFRPDEHVTREQAMTMLARAMEWTDLQTEAEDAEPESRLEAFADANDVSAWAVEGVAAGLKTGLVNGRGDRLAPKESITRAEAAALVQRLLTKAELI